MRGGDEAAVVGVLLCLLVGTFFVVLALGVVGRCVVGEGARVLGNLVVTSGGIL